MVMCAMFGCNNNNNKNLKNAANNSNFISFYTFPKNELLCKEWIKKCARSDKFIAKNARICSIHFSLDDFERNLMNEMLKIENAPKKLKEGAIPTSNLFTFGNEKPSKTDESYKGIVCRENKLMVTNLLKPKKKIPNSDLLFSEFSDIPINETEQKILNFVPVEGNDYIENLSTNQIKTERDDPLDPLNESYYFHKCKCYVPVKTCDKSVQCNLYEEQIEPNEISFTNVENNNTTNNKIDTISCNDMDVEVVDTIIYNDNDVTVDNIILYSSLSESSEDEAKFDELFTKSDKSYVEAYTIVDDGYKCNKCNKISKTRANFLRHSVSHLEYSKLCYGCGKIYENLYPHLMVCPSLNKAKNINKIKVYKRCSEIRKCKFCGKIFKSPLELNDHENIHNNLKPYICSCGSTCRFFCNFIIHLKKFKCPVDKCIIPKYAPQNIQLWINRDSKYQYRQTTTDVAQSGSKFKITKNKIKKNIIAEERSSKRKKLPDSQLNCKECGIDKFPNYVRYREHLETNHLEKKFECKDKRCVHKFATERRLREHVKDFHLIQYKCEICNLVFNRRTYRRHNLICSGLNNEKITVSNYRTTFRNQLFYCSICTEYEEHWKIVRHFTNDYHKNLEKTWKEKYNIEEYECTKCKVLSKFQKNNIYNFFMHLVKTHKYCFILQINDIFKAFENNEPFIFNLDVESANIAKIIIDE